MKKLKTCSSATSSDEKISRTTLPLYIEVIVENIFSHLGYDSLCIALKVCSFWHKKAQERLLKNYSPFLENLPVMYCKDIELEHSIDKYHCVENNPRIKNLLNTLPEKVAIIFTDGKFPKEFSDLINEMTDNLSNITYHYLKLLPHASLVVHELIYLDDIVIDGEQNLMTGVFFPKIPSIEIRSCIVTERRMYKYFEYSDVLPELFDLDDPEDKNSCFIILGLSDKNCIPEKNSKFIQGILNYLKNMNNTHKLTVWGGAHVEIVHKAIYTGSQKIHWHLLHIIGIKSYSIALSLNLNEEIFEKTLQDFKDKIVIKKGAFALAITHTKDSESENIRSQILKKVLLFKDIFNIRLNTILSRVTSTSCDPVIFCNVSDNANLRIENERTVGYLIINN